MRNLSRALAIAFAGILVAGATHAQAPLAPPPGTAAPNAEAAPPPPPQAGPDADAPPPPPGDPGRRPPPPPPPRGAAFMIDRGLNGTVRVDVKCAERDSTRDCAEVTAQFIDKLNAGVKPR